jgi:hypothetical protein
VKQIAIKSEYNFLNALLHREDVGPEARQTQPFGILN